MDGTRAESGITVNTKTLSTMIHCGLCDDRSFGTQEAFDAHCISAGAHKGRYCKKCKRACRTDAEFQRVRLTFCILYLFNGDVLTDKYPFFSMSGVTMDLSINVAYVMCRPSKVAN